MTGFRTAIGLMSGTSLDGVDVALLKTDGEAIEAFGPARTYPYAEADRELLRAALCAAATLTDRNARPGIVGEAERLVTARHAEAVATFLADFSIDRGGIDLIGFHGQTVLHDPGRALTVQVGDGQALADRLGVPVAWDFRARDMQEGGQGAPLAPVFHRALARHAACPLPVVFLNLGGVANVTYVGDDGKLIAFDTGPGNSLLDDWAAARIGEPFDRDGRLAAQGEASQRHLQALLAHPYFDAPPPKSLDRNAFSVGDLAGLGDSDGAATLLQFSARSVAKAVAHFPVLPLAWYACGGGRHNHELIKAMGGMLGSAALAPIEALGFDGDATEAQAFAYLAVRAADGRALSYPRTTGVPTPTTGGRVSRPSSRGHRDIEKTRQS